MANALDQLLFSMAEVQFAASSSASDSQDIDLNERENGHEAAAGSDDNLELVRSFSRR